MRKIIFATAIVALVGCKKTSDGGLNSVAETVKGANSLRNISNSMDEIKKNGDALKGMAPLTNDEIKAPIPETLLGLKRQSLSAGETSAMKISSASAAYSDGANKNIELTITDGAGETGSAMLSLINMSLAADSEKTTETGFEKKTEINGTKALLKQEKDGDEVNSEIVYVVKNRYTVSIKGSGFSAEELGKAMQEINVSTLK